jgi:hypothetical protein
LGLIADAIALQQELMDKGGKPKDRPHALVGKGRTPMTRQTPSRRSLRAVSGAVRAP